MSTQMSTQMSTPMSTEPELSLQQTMSEQIEYLDALNSSGGLSAEDWSTAINRHQEIMRSAILGGPDLQPCHAVVLLKLLAADVLPHEVRVGLTKIINSKVGNHVARAGATSCSPGNTGKGEAAVTGMHEVLLVCH